MSNMTAKQREAAALEELEKMDGEGEINPSNPHNFNIVANKPLPEGFENPPCGEEGHFCVDRGGAYKPDWAQLLIEKMHDKQIDPVEFPLSARYSVPLNTWVDAPPEVIESLRSAVETRHQLHNEPGDVVLGGEKKEITSYTVRRFVWNMIPSAKV